MKYKLGTRAICIASLSVTLDKWMVDPMWGMRISYERSIFDKTLA